MLASCDPKYLGNQGRRSGCLSTVFNKLVRPCVKIKNKRDGVYSSVTKYPGFRPQYQGGKKKKKRKRLEEKGT